MAVGQHSAGWKRQLPPFAVAALFLLPNFLGFVIFLLFPIVLSLAMSFTNWNLKPAVELEWVGLRNYSDLLGVRLHGEANVAVLGAYVAACVGAAGGLLGAAWMAIVNRAGSRWGGVLLLGLGLAGFAGAAFTPWAQAVVFAGLVATFIGLAILTREDGTWAWGWGGAPAVALLVSCAALALLHPAMWSRYQPNDPYFWYFLYNTLFLMAGLPLGIGGALGLALLVNENMPMGGARSRCMGALLCLVCGVLCTALLAALGLGNLAVLAALLWGLSAAGIGFNVIAFRTVFYLPTFTAGVALMILWKTLYNPETGPINVVLEGLFAAAGIQAEPPRWLVSVTWAKPALIIMGTWISIGGMNMLLFLAGLSTVPGTLIDAANVDGAGAWGRFRHVIWPHLAPTTFFITIISVIGGLQGGFEQARVMTLGGPAGSTTTLSYYIYSIAFRELDLAKASAISWVLFLIVFGATAINWRFGKELEVE